MKTTPLYEGFFSTTNLTKEKTNADRNYYAVKSNGLIQNKRYQSPKSIGASMSLLEQKILLYIISQIKPTDDSLSPIEFNVCDFYRLMGMDAYLGKNYRNVKDAIQRLANRSEWLSYGDQEILVRWISKAGVNKRSGKITIILDDDMKPYLLNLKKNYTQIPLRDILSMKSKYSIMLYELLKSYSFVKNGRMRFEAQDLLERLDCLSPAFCSNFSNFRTKVIEKALTDINKYTEIKVEAEYVKEKGRYVAVIFDIINLRKPSNVDKKRLGEDAIWSELQQRLQNADQCVSNASYQEQPNCTP